MSELRVDNLVPGGIRSDDRPHVDVYDGTCSRCRRQIGECEVPTMLWSDDGATMWVYCQSCDGADPGIWDPEDTDVPANGH